MIHRKIACVRWLWHGQHRDPYIADGGVVSPKLLAMLLLAHVGLVDGAYLHSRVAVADVRGDTRHVGDIVQRQIRH